MNMILINNLIIIIVVLGQPALINSIAGRCYLCAQNNLAECVGSDQADSTIYAEILRYYTEPCNGQCVLFRDEQNSVIRGCSWTYGHMNAKSTGWHQISPGISAYFCDSHLCNNGTYESYQEPKLIMQIQPTQIQIERKCYTCTERYQGCGEYLDPIYASHYIQSCDSSCVLFRNPNDMNMITRDCATSWPEIVNRNGLQKILGSDAFFCEESLCNGIGYDFIMGIFYNQMPSFMSIPRPSTTTLINLDDESIIWDDSDLDYADTTIPTLIPTTELSTMQWWNSTETSEITSTITTNMEEEDESTMLFNMTSLPPIVSHFEHLLINEETSPTTVFTTSTTTTSTSTTTTTTATMSTTTTTTTATMSTTTTTTTATMSTTTMTMTTTIRNTTTVRSTSNSPYEYCKNQICHNGGRLNSDCLCICLPAYTGENCQTVLCDQEPAHICQFVLEEECQSEWIRYLCPKFCTTKRCAPKLRHIHDYYH